MSHPKLDEIKRVELLFDDGKLDEALELMNDRSRFEGLTSQQKGYYQFLKGLILLYQHKTDEAIKLGEQLLEEGKKIHNNLQLFDGYFFVLTGLGFAFKFGEAYKLIEEAEATLRSISNISKNELIQREARMSVLKAWINLFVGNIDVAEKCLERTLSLEKELANTFEIVWANMAMTQIMVRGKMRFDLGLEYTKKALLLAKEIKFNHYWIAFCELGLGVIYSAIGELDTSVEHSMKSLTIYKEIKNEGVTAMLLNNIGRTYAEIGEYDLALEYLEESILLKEKDPTRIEDSLESIISIALKKGDIEQAQKYFHRLEDLYNQKKEGRIVLLYHYNKALILKRSSRIRDKAKTEELLKQVIESESFYFDIVIDAHIHLCDILLSEFRINNNSEVLEELNQYIAKLLTIAEKSHSYLVFCETFILQAKLALVNFNIKEARRFLTQAQKIAESYGIKRLAMKISYEHDELLKHSKMWENFKESGVSLSERWKFAGLSEQMENMVRKRMIEVPELSNEEPVILLIVSEGGIPFISQSFIAEKSFESHLFGGFLTTIDYFVKEVFSEGLDRAIFGDYTLLMKAIPPFFVSYIFKGASYYALQKLDNFIENVQKDDEIWKKLLRNFQANQSIKLKDFPLLDSLITETFLTKNPIFI